MQEHNFYLNTIFVFLQHQNTDLKINTPDRLSKQEARVRKLTRACLVTVQVNYNSLE